MFRACDRVGTGRPKRLYGVQFVTIRSVVGLWLLLPSVAAAADVYPNKCAGCHIVTPRAPAPEHVVQWSLSLHGRKGVGCDKCHGGDPNTSDRAKAHAGVLNAGNPASRVYFRNVPATCGTCHEGPFAAFQRSQHYKLLANDDRRGPVCVTCHTPVSARLLSGLDVEKQCKTCHEATIQTGRAIRAEEMRILYQSLHESRDLLRLTKTRVENVRDKARRAQLQASYGQAEALLIDATDAGHQFDYGDLKSRLSNGRRRVDELMTALDHVKR